MKERPILFSAPMVRAILAGTKTQTRRALKPDGKYRLDLVAPADGGPSRCPYGQPGDRLWVRETWLRHSVNVPNDLLYRADHPDDGIIGPAHGGWKPSIHMPRAASRILLDVVSVRVERLQDISEADALSEGIVQLKDGGYGLPAGEHYHAADPRQSYLSLWEAINGAGSVEANHWVWVVEFERVEQ